MSLVQPGAPAAGPAPLAPAHPPEGAPRDWLPLVFWGLVLGVLTLGVLLAWGKAPDVAQVIVPAHRVAAYQALSAADGRTMPLAAGRVPSDTIHSAADLADRYSRVALVPGEPVRASGLVAIPPGLVLTGTRLLAVPLAPALALGAGLAPGDVVRVAAVPTGPGPAAVVLTDVLVLDVRPVLSETVLTLAVPELAWLGAVRAMHDGPLFVTKPLR